MTSPFLDGLLPTDLDVDKLRSNAASGGAAANAAAPKEETPNTEPTATSDQLLLLRCLQDHSIPKTDCFGGVLFSREDSAGNPIFTFVVEGMDDAELQQTLDAYNKLFRSGIRDIIYMNVPFVETAHNPDTAQRYTAFNFIRSSNMVSLRDFSVAHPRDLSPSDLMAALYELIAKNHNNNRPYRCLNCISPDTIFVENSYNGSEELCIYLLPLRAFRNCFPLEIAPEAHTPGALCDESSDLHAAAYVSMEAFYNFKLPKEINLKDSSILKRCLSSVPQLRPSLKEVYSTLFDTEKEEPTPAPAPRPSPVGEDTKRSIRSAANRVVQWCKHAGETVVDYFATEPEDHRRGTMPPHESGLKHRKAPRRKHHIQPIPDETQEDDNR